MNWLVRQSAQTLPNLPDLHRQEAEDNYEQITSLFATVTTLIESVRDLSMTVSELNSIVRKQEEELTDTKTRLQESESTINELRGQAEKSDSYIKELESSVNEFRAESKSNADKIDTEMKKNNSIIGRLQIRVKALESSTKDQILELNSVVDKQRFTIEDTVDSLRDTKHRIQDLSTTLDISAQELTGRTIKLEEHLGEQRDDTNKLADRLRRYDEGETTNFGLMMDAMTDIIADATANGIQTLTEQAIEATATGVRALKESASDLSEFCDDDPIRKKNEARLTLVNNPFSSTLGWILLIL